jgi:hypothetical protein
VPLPAAEKVEKTLNWLNMLCISPIFPADGQQSPAEQQMQAHQIQAVQPQQQPEQPVLSPPSEAGDEPSAAVPVPLTPPPQEKNFHFM